MYLTEREPGFNTIQDVNTIQDDIDLKRTMYLTEREPGFNTIQDDIDLKQTLT